MTDGADSSGSLTQKFVKETDVMDGAVSSKIHGQSLREKSWETMGRRRALTLLEMQWETKLR
jgi:hypothetical protein